MAPDRRRRQGAMMDEVLRKKARTIGFNTAVEVGERRLHVQTEVFGRARLRVTSTVTEAGALLWTRDTACEQHLESLESIAELAKAQHDAMIDAARRGGEDGAYR